MAANAADSVEMKQMLPARPSPLGNLASNSASRACLFGSALNL
ncbi:MAG: hypothetical protein R3B96_22640 [Pirellulaceae bacterium]